MRVPACIVHDLHMMEIFHDRRWMDLICRRKKRSPYSRLNCTRLALCSWRVRLRTMMADAGAERGRASRDLVPKLEEADVWRMTSIDFEARLVSPSARVST
jgi:hypothetical protein